MISPDLIADAHRLLNRARMIAEAPAAQAATIGHGHPSGGEPSGAWSFSRSTLETFHDRLTSAIATGDDDAVRAAIDRCEDELQILQTGPKGRIAETTTQFEYRLATGYPGVAAGRVAIRERTSETTVRNARTKWGKTAARGHDPPKVKDEDRPAIEEVTDDG